MKRIQRWQKYWKSLAWLGPALIIMGISAAYISGDFSPLPLGILITGVVLFGTWLLFQGQLVEEQQARRWWGRRSTQAGTNALAATLSILVVLGLLNFLSVRYSKRVDFTENQLFTLAPQSQQVVQTLERPVKVWLFDRSSSSIDIDKALLENYRRYGDQFSFEYVDPDQKRALTQDFGVQNNGDVFLESGDRRQFLQNLSADGRLSEAKLTAALEQITSDQQSKVYFLQGHGERPLTQAKGSLAQAVQTLEDKNYISEPLKLIDQEGKLPQDASVVVVAGPTESLFEGEVKALQDYLNQGGGVLLMLDPETSPGIDKLLNDWGISLDSRLAINLSNQQIVGLGPTAILIDEYADHPITRDFANRYSFYRQARPLEVQEVKGIEAIPILLTNDRTWALDLEGRQDFELDPSRDIQGPLTLGVALRRPLQADAESKSESSKPETKTSKPNASDAKAPSPSPSPTGQKDDKDDKAETAKETEAKAAKEKTREARLVVLGNSSFAADGFFEQQLNGDVFLNAVSWLSQRDDRPLSIRPKEVKERRIAMNPQQSRLLSWLALLILPLVGFGTAVAAWRFRR